MKRLLSLACLSFLIATKVLANEAPTSAEQLRNELETALKAGDSNAVMSLYYLDGLVDGRRELSDDERKMAFMQEIWPTFATNVISVKLLPLPTNFKNSSIPKNDNGMGDSWEGDNGWRMRWSVSALGMLEVNPSNKYANPLLYGKTNGFYYVGIPIVYLAPGKLLNVRVQNSPDSATYTGSWIFVKGGKEITVNISNKTNEFRDCWGDYIKSCTIRRASTNEANWFNVQISEDGTNIFESGEITNEAPIVYERK